MIFETLTGAPSKGPFYSWTVAAPGRPQSRSPGGNRISFEMRHRPNLRTRHGKSSHSTQFTRFVLPCKG
jgi:hypothetical protein